MKLYSYYRSTAAYRIRIALNYKNIDYEIIPINLLTGEQRQAEYLQHNPHGRVPTLQDDNFELGQSMAILEYLEEQDPNAPLLPQGVQERAYVRYLADIIACDMHPLNNSSVLAYLKKEMGQSKAQTNKWYHHWLKNGFDALEIYLSKSEYKGKCCFRDDVTFADVCLIPQIYNADRFKFPMDAYPTLMAINEYCLNLPAFDKARPELQPDSPSGV